MEEVQAAFIRLPPAGDDAGLLALRRCVLGERYELAARLLDIALDQARREGHAAPAGDPPRAPWHHRAPAGLVERRAGGGRDRPDARAAIAPHRAVLVAVAIEVQIERGAPDAAEDLVRNRGRARGRGGSARTAAT